jgi:D-alanine transaminase
MKNLGYYNGKVAPLDELTVPFNDRVHFFGDGVYEATLARNYKIYALDEHLDRLYRSASMVDIHIRESK